MKFIRYQVTIEVQFLQQHNNSEIQSQHFWCSLAMYRFRRWLVGCTNPSTKPTVICHQWGPLWNSCEDINKTCSRNQLSTKRGVVHLDLQRHTTFREQCESCKSSFYSIWYLKHVIHVVMFSFDGHTAHTAPKTMSLSIYLYNPNFHVRHSIIFLMHKDGHGSLTSTQLPFYHVSCVCVRTAQR